MKYTKEYKSSASALITVTLIAMAGANCMAALTDISQNDMASGHSLAQSGGTLDILYGLGNLVRIDDVGADMTDQYWTFADGRGKVTATAKAKYAGFKHDFGYMPGESGSEFKKLFNSGSSHYGLYDNGNYKKYGKGSSMTGSFSDSGGFDVFRFGLDIISKPGYRWSSAIADNQLMPNGKKGDGIDHMVTYKIVGADKGHAGNTVGSYIVAFEDLAANKSLGGFDGDYGDLVVEIAGAMPTGHGYSGEVPEPASMCLLGLGGLLITRRQTHSKTKTKTKTKILR